MAIIVESAPSYRTCSCCASNKDVIEITALRRVGNSNQGTEVALCKKCACVLVGMLQDRGIGKEVRVDETDNV